MRQNKNLIVKLAAAAAIVTLAGASAFADSRPQRGTRDSGGAIRRDTGGARVDAGRNSAPPASADSRRSDGGAIRRGDGRPSEGSIDVRPGDDRRGNGDVRRGDGDVRRGDRNRGDGDIRRGDGDIRRGDGDFRRGDGNRGDGNRGDGRYEPDRNRGDRRGNPDYRRGDSGNRGGHYGSRGRNEQPYHHRGRVSRYHRYGNGYRVWIVGAPYPFFVPDRYWHRDRFRVGLWINLGGWYNPGGWYDYYDGYDGYYDNRYYDRRSYTRGVLRGIVESVDGRRTSFVLRNEDTGSYVTVLPRARRVYVRPGDYVEVDGTWTRSGFFTAYDIDWLDRDRYDDRWDDDERWD